MIVSRRHASLMTRGCTIVKWMQAAGPGSITRSRYPPLENCWPEPVFTEEFLFLQS